MVGHEWPEEEKAGRFSRISIIAFLAMLGYIVISNILTFMFNRR